MNIIEKLIPKKPDEKEIKKKADEAISAAKIYADELKNALNVIGSLNDLLNNPQIQFDSRVHIKLTLASDAHLIHGKSICVIFDQERAKPICATLVDLK